MVRFRCDEPKKLGTKDSILQHGVRDAGAIVRLTTDVLAELRSKMALVSVIRRTFIKSKSHSSLERPSSLAVVDFGAVSITSHRHPRYSPKTRNVRGT